MCIELDRSSPKDQAKQDQTSHSNLVVRLLIAMAVGGVAIALLALGIWKAIELGKILCQGL